MLKSHHFSAILTAAQIIFDWTELDFLDSLRKAVKDARLTSVGELSYSFQPQGISAILLLEESHVSLHFWPEKGKVTVDIHVCDYLQNNQKKAQTLANLLTLQLSEDPDGEQWHYLSITG